MKLRLTVFFIAVAILFGFGFTLIHSEVQSSNEAMVGFYIDISAYNVSQYVDEVEYTITAGGNVWGSGTFDPSANKPQVHFVAPVSQFLGDISVYLEYYGEEGCIHYRTIVKDQYFCWPNTYTYTFTSYLVGICDR